MEALASQTKHCCSSYIRTITQQQNVERLIRIWEPYRVDTMYEKRSTLDDTKCDIHKAPELINEDEELLSTSPSHEDHLLSEHGTSRKVCKCN